MREKHLTRSRIFIATLIIMLVSAFLAFTVLFFTDKMEEEMHGQLQENLRDVGRQNVKELKTQIHNNELLLEGLASELMESDDETQTINQYRNFAEAYGLKRLGYCSSDGMAVSTDGSKADLSVRVFFQRGMKGKNTITGVLQDALSPEHDHIKVMSIPVEDQDSSVKGVSFMTYRIDDFNQALKISSFDGQGSSFAVNEKGEIMVSMGENNLKLGDNLNGILADNPGNQEVVSSMWRSLHAGTKAYGTLYLNEAVYFYAIPVSLMDGDVTWYMFTVVPKDYFDQRLTTVRKFLYRMDQTMIAAILLGVFMIGGLYGKQRREAMRLAYTDPLTGGANYAKFCLVLGNERSKQGYLVFLDIQNFGNINIAAGRTAGDAMIVDIWHVLQKAVGTNEAAARVRDDYFILFLLEQDQNRLLVRIEEISKEIHGLTKILQVPGVYPKYGIYELREDESAEDGYVKAQNACKYVNSDRSRYYIFYDEINHDAMREEQCMEERFDESLNAEEFEVWYQPKFSVDGNEMVGCEALVRWKNDDGSKISPERFVPLFEKNGMITRLDEYMFRSVCRQQSLWKNKGYHIVPVSVNLSRASLFYADLVEKYGNILQEYHLEPEYVQIEVTESAVEGKGDISTVLNQFRDMGIRTLMDDFGTGYSSLSVLSMKCFDTLKLDKSLIDHIGEENGETLLYHVICMGKQMGLHITAEGVENLNQLKFLQELQCDDIQGFLFSRPLPIDKFEEIMGKAE